MQHQASPAVACPSCQTLAVTDTMQRFNIYSGDTLIGWSHLEEGDAPMGCASGRLLPLLAYPAFRQAIIESSEGPQTHLGLSVRTADGQALEAVGGIRVVDFTNELSEEEGLHVSVYGVGYPAYEALFPEHVAAYGRQFKNGG